MVNSYNIDESSKLLTQDFLGEGLDLELSRVVRFKRELSMVLVELEILSPEYKSEKYTFFQQLSRIVRNVVRTVDYAVRLGSRILIVLPETGLEGAQKVLLKLKEKVKSFDFSLEDSPVKMELKGSLVTFPKDGEGKEALLEKLNKELKII